MICMFLYLLSSNLFVNQMVMGWLPCEMFQAVFDNLVKDVMEVHGGHLNVGIVGVKELLPALRYRNDCCR